MIDHQVGSGVQVLEVTDDGKYRVCSEALRSVAARAELRGLPAAVVSVAGATRGGKSFLLDFFLRYLRATPAARVGGSWLGTDDEPLGGFSWRGGCERDTTGIMIWSEPIVVTQEIDGIDKQVVVLLMDTQGTFDSCSTIRDSTTVFAMSTLLSSVQIYNLSQNIKEDDLQYLQLFTEYGKLAKEEAGKPFQALQFLVRDWSYAYEHPFGAVGGQQLLDKRLQINESQAEELREIREHVHSCFESVRGFLLPHPGFAVTSDPTFTGCLKDISTSFKSSLQELVKGVFENLTLKKINGQEVQVHELVEYFESYIEVFNSDQMPTPVSILKATSSACLEMARSASRALYCERMEHDAARSVPRAAMPRLHAAAREAARAAFLARRSLAAPEQATARLDNLIQELDQLLPNYIALNEAKVERAVAACKDAYEACFSANKCLLPNELDSTHQDAMEQCHGLFVSLRTPLDEDNEDGDTEDEDWNHLEQELQHRLEHHRQKNEVKISSTVAECVQQFEQQMSLSHSISSICVLEARLETMNRTAVARTLKMFDSCWSSIESAQNQHRSQLQNKITGRFLEIKRINSTNNESAVTKALDFYENSMFGVLGLTEPRLNSYICLHPADFQTEHRNQYRLTIVEFYRSRTFGDDGSGRDDYKLKLIQELVSRCNTLKEANELRNKIAVKKAHEYYEDNMRIQRVFGHAAGPGAWDYVLEFLGPPDFNVWWRHGQIRPLSINRFQTALRRAGSTHNEDKHLDELNKLINSSFNWLVAKVGAQVAFNIGNVALLAASWFR